MARAKQRKRSAPSSAKGPKAKLSKNIDLGWKDDYQDGHIDSDDDDDNELLERQQHDEPSLEDEEQEETLDAKRVRLARDYLQKLEGDSLESSSSSEEEEEDIDEDPISRKLQRDRLKREGIFERDVADVLAQNMASIRESLKGPKEETSSWVDSGRMKLLRGHNLTPTCVALQSSGARAVSGSKDHSVILWDVERECKIMSVCESWKTNGSKEDRSMGQVLSVACSDDERFLAVGKKDASVYIYDLRVSGQMSGPVKTFTGHKAGVTALTFRTQSLQLFSGSEDRCIRHYNLEEMLYVETLYGHQFGVSGIDCHRKERPVSVGRDRTARAWKLTEDTHLIFRGGGKVSSADCVSLMKDDWFLTGHDDGNLSLWMTEKKRAAATVTAAHGLRGSVGAGIASINALQGSDVAVTGSSDGHLRFWKVRTGRSVSDRGIDPLFHLPLTGFINGVAIGPKAQVCVAVVGQEPRLGRWDRVARSKNRFCIIRLGN